MRDLWSLRLSKLLHKLEDTFDGTDTESQGVSSRVGSQDQSDGQTVSAQRKLASRSPILLDTICLCYMAMLLMRLPISLSEVLRWICEEDIPYVRAIRHVPAEMKDKLPGEYHEALDTSTVLRPDALQLGVSNICSMYERSYGLSTAALNWPSMLYQYIEKLSLPLEVYGVAEKLNDIVAFDFMFANGRERRRRAISYPEVQLVSLVVVATKLLFPFDSEGVPHNPCDSSDPAMMSIDWSVWVDDRESRTEAEGNKDLLRDGMEIKVKDKDVFNMSPQQLDQYMDWYQRTWAGSDTADNDVSKELLDMFPLKQISGKPIDKGKIQLEEKTKNDRIANIQANLKTNEIVSDEQAEESKTDVIRPGMRYRQFRNQDDLDTSRVAMLFHQEVAELSCLPIGILLRAVLQTEQTITLWRQAKRRAERFGETMSLEAEDVLPSGLVGLEQMTLAEAAVDEAPTFDAQEEEDDADSDSTDSQMRIIE